MNETLTATDIEERIETLEQDVVRRRRRLHSSEAALAYARRRLAEALVDWDEVESIARAEAADWPDWLGVSVDRDAFEVRTHVRLADRVAGQMGDADLGMEWADRAVALQGALIRAFAEAVPGQVYRELTFPLG